MSNTCLSAWPGILIDEMGDGKMDKTAGCETQTPVIVTNAEDVGDITVEGDKIVIGG